MDHRYVKPLALLVVCGLFALGYPGISAATDPSGAKIYTAGDTISYSQETLQTYAVAALELHDIKQRWQPRIQSAKSQEEAIEMESMANSEMIDAVEAKGLTVEQFNSITTVAREDPEVNKQIMEILAEQSSR